MNTVAQNNPMGPSAEAVARERAGLKKSLEPRGAIAECGGPNGTMHAGGDFSLAATLLGGLAAVDFKDPVGAILCDVAVTLEVLMDLLSEASEPELQRISSMLFHVTERVRCADRLRDLAPARSVTAGGRGLAAALGLLEAARAEQELVEASLERGDIAKARYNLEVAGEQIEQAEAALIGDAAAVGDAE